MSGKAHQNTAMTKPGKTGIGRLVAATGYSIKGFKAAWQHEEAFRTEILVALVLIPLAFWLGQNAAERGLLLLTLSLVIIAELANTAIESIVDRIGSEHNPLSGQAKDLGSAIVLVTLILFLVIWVPSLWQFTRHLLASA